MQYDLVEIRPPQQNAIGGGLEGAERTTRETVNWDSPIISPDRQINPVKEDADARGRDRVQNDGFAAGAVQIHRDSIVGAQFILNAHPDYELLGADEAWAEEYQAYAESKFNLLSDSPECWLDASGRMTFTDMIRLAVGGFLYTGELLATVEWLREAGRPYSTAIQMISPSRLCNQNGEPDNRLLRRGVVRDNYGRPQGYWIRLSHPGDLYIDRVDMQWKYIEARKPWGRRQVIHIIEPLQPDQTRGISEMVSVLKKMKMTQQFQDITLQNAVVNATYAAAVESELPSDVVFAAMGAGQQGFAAMLGEYMSALSTYVAGSKNIAIDGVKMPHLFPGTKLSLKPLGTPGGVGTDFESSLLRYTAAGLGLSYEEFSRDFSKSSYSSNRASMGQTYKFMQGRKKTVADKFATMVYHLTVEEDLNAGLLPLPPGFTKETFYSDPLKRAALLDCEWIGASRGQIDEMKETQAAVMRIKSGLSTHERECARLGEDYRKIFRQLSREQRLAEKLQLEFAMDATKPGANEAKKTMQDE